MNKLITQLVIASALTLLSVNSWADSGKQKNDRSAVSQKEAARIVRQQKGGRVLDIKRRSSSGRPGYRVKTIEKGRVRIYGVDGQTGEIRE